METILVISENSLTTETICQSILPEFGCQGVLAANGAAALDSLDRDGLEFDLVILDWGLPNLFGVDQLRELRNRGVVAPAIALMDNPDHDIPIRALELGLEKIIYKPISVENLGESINNILDRKRLYSKNIALTNRIKEQYIWTEAITSAGRYIVSSVDLDEIVVRIVESSLRLTSAHQASIAIYDRVKNRVILKAYKTKMEKDPRVVDIDISNAYLDKVVSEGKPFRISKEHAFQFLEDVNGLFVDSIFMYQLLIEKKS